MRTVYVYAALNVNYDFTWILYDCWIYTQLEINVAIIAACAPALRPLVSRFSQFTAKYNKSVTKAIVRPLSQRISMYTEKTYVNSVTYPNEDVLEGGHKPLAFRNPG